MNITENKGFDPDTAKLLQISLSKLVRIEPLDLSSIDAVAGVDIGYKGSSAVGVAVAYSIKKRTELCHVAVAGTVHVPYIPGLLAFREAPLMILAIRELSARCIEPDVVMVNGHGLAHPRKMGIASHIGVVLDKPSIGVAKRHLYGSISVDEAGRRTIVVDGAVVGYVLEGEGVEIYVSIGNRVTAQDARLLVEALWDRSKPLPKPLYTADILTKKLRARL